MSENCHVDPLVKNPTTEELSNTSSIILAVQGMGCLNCAKRVRNSLLSVYGVSESDVNHLVGVARVTYNPTLTNVPALAEAVARAGSDGQHEYRAMPIA